MYKSQAFRNNLSTILKKGKSKFFYKKINNKFILRELINLFNINLLCLDIKYIFL
jgi:hypothetical protein